MGDDDKKGPFRPTLEVEALMRKGSVSEIMEMDRMPELKRLIEEMEDEEQLPVDVDTSQLSSADLIRDLGAELESMHDAVREFHEQPSIVPFNVAVMGLGPMAEEIAQSLRLPLQLELQSLNEQEQVFAKYTVTLLGSPEYGCDIDAPVTTRIINHALEVQPNYLVLVQPQKKFTTGNERDLEELLNTVAKLRGSQHPFTWVLASNVFYPERVRLNAEEGLKPKRQAFPNKIFYFDPRLYRFAKLSLAGERALGTPFEELRIAELKAYMDEHKFKGGRLKQMRDQVTRRKQYIIDHVVNYFKKFYESHPKVKRVRALKSKLNGNHRQ